MLSPSGPNASQLRAVSGGPSTGRARPKPTPVAPLLLPQRPALRLGGGVCAGTGKPMPQRVVRLACVSHRVQRHGCAFTQGTDLPWNAQTQFSCQGATGVFSHGREKPARGEGHSSPGASQGAFWPLFCNDPCAPLAAVKRLGDPDERVRWAAAVALARHDGATIEAIPRRLTSSELAPEPRHTAACVPRTVPLMRT